MSLAVATVPGKLGEGIAQSLESQVVELNSAVNTPVVVSLLAVNPGLRADGVSIYNGSPELVRATFRDSAGNAIGLPLNANGQQLVHPGHTIQLGFDEANPVAFVDLVAVGFPASIPTGQSVRANLLIPQPAASANSFVTLNFIEK